MLELCDGIRSRGLRHTFECETRLDRLDDELLATMHRAGLRAMSFGVESVAAATLKKVGRRPIPEAHQRAILARCRELGIVTAAFYVFGFAEDTWESISATIDYAIDLGSTVAQFKILTPIPGTPLFKRIEPPITETDWERFDGFTPMFRHPAPDAGRTAAPARQRLRAVLRAAVVPGQLPAYLGAGGPRALVDAARCAGRARSLTTRAGAGGAVGAMLTGPAAMRAAAVRRRSAGGDRRRRDRLHRRGRPGRAGPADPLGVLAAGTRRRDRRPGVFLPVSRPAATVAGAVSGARAASDAAASLVSGATTPRWCC